MESCAGVGLKVNSRSGIESNAWARFRCSAIVRPRNTVVMGFACAAAVGCWAARADGSRASAASTAYDVFLIMGPLGEESEGIVVILGAAPRLRNGFGAVS